MFLVTLNVTNHIYFSRPNCRNSYAFSSGQIENIARKCRIECILEGKKPAFDMVKTFCDEELLARPRTQITGFQNNRHNDE